MRPSRLAAALAALVLLATGCTGDDAGIDTSVLPSESRVDVDTPELRTLKTAAGIADCPAPDPAAEPGALPAVSVACLGGGPDVDLSLLRGPVVLNFWQTSCGACRREMPMLGEFDRRYGDQVPVIGIDSQDTVPAEAIRFAGKRGATYPQLADPGGDLFEEVEFARAVGYPYTAIVDADGVIQTQKVGEIKSLEEMVELVDGALGTDLGGGG